MSVESAREALRAFYVQEATQAHLQERGFGTRDDCIALMDAALERYKDEIEAALPCYHTHAANLQHEWGGGTCAGWHAPDPCPTCAARKRLEAG